MTDQQEPHQPVLKPKSDAKFKTVRRKERVRAENHEPTLLSEGVHHQKVKPPYVLIALIVIGVALAFWKMWMYGGAAEMDKHYQQVDAVTKGKMQNSRGYIR